MKNKHIYEFQGIKPVVHPSAFIHPLATVIGNVIIGKDVYIGPGAVLRGDWGKIIINDGCNVQENCVIHMFPGKDVILEPSAHVGHGAIIHGGILRENCLIGMGAVIMDDVEIGKESIIGALAFVPANTKIPERKLAVGNPAKIIKDVSDEMIRWKTEGTKLYQQLPEQCHKTLKPCEPLSHPPKFQKELKIDYKTWKETKS
ncbi:MAG: transferase hexapeptide repeat family protein [Bacteroidetes bacterium]|nr:MAG: transferase hexapeptide repeat family protein [Bacteroidota bacterium]